MFRAQVEQDGEQKETSKPELDHVEAEWANEERAMQKKRNLCHHQVWLACCCRTRRRRAGKMSPKAGVKDRGPSPVTVAK